MTVLLAALHGCAAAVRLALTSRSAGPRRMGVGRVAGLVLRHSATRAGARLAASDSPLEREWASRGCPDSTLQCSGGPSAGLSASLGGTRRQNLKLLQLQSGMLLVLVPGLKLITTSLIPIHVKGGFMD